MLVKPHEMAVDRINNLPVAVVSPAESLTGDPIVAKTGAKERILLASLNPYTPNMNEAGKYMFMLGGAFLDLVIPPPNVTGSLHIGHLVGLMMLKRLQHAGHRPIALV